MFPMPNAFVRAFFVAPSLPLPIKQLEETVAALGTVMAAALCTPATRWRFHLEVWPWCCSLAIPCPCWSRPGPGRGNRTSRSLHGSRGWAGHTPPRHLQLKSIIASFLKTLTNFFFTSLEGIYIWEQPQMFFARRIHHLFFKSPRVKSVMDESVVCQAWHSSYLGSILAIQITDFKFYFPSLGWWNKKLIQSRQNKLVG